VGRKTLTQSVNDCCFWGLQELRPALCLCVVSAHVSNADSQMVEEFFILYLLQCSKCYSVLRWTFKPILSRSQCVDVCSTRNNRCCAECLCRPTQDQLLIDWTATINELQSPASHVTSPDAVSLGDVTGSVYHTHKRIAIMDLFMPAILN